MSRPLKRRRLTRDEERALTDNDQMFDIESDFQSDASPPRFTIRRYRTLSPVSEHASDVTRHAPNRGSPSASLMNRAGVSPLRSPGLSPISRRSSTSRSPNRTISRSRSPLRSPKRSPSRSSSARGRARSSGVSR